MKVNMYLLRMCSIESFDLLMILLRHTRFVLIENVDVFLQIDSKPLFRIDDEERCSMVFRWLNKRKDDLSRLILAKLTC